MTVTPGGSRVLKHKRRYCRNPGCTRIVKSQGLCQRHGAKPRMCKVFDCGKQAQGNFDGMCKSHFKAMKQCMTSTPLPSSIQSLPCVSENDESQPYQSTSSITHKLHPSSVSSSHVVPVYQTGTSRSAATTNMAPPSHASHATTLDSVITPTTAALMMARRESVWDRILPNSVIWKSNHSTNNNDIPDMPLVAHLKHGCETRPCGWHRNDEYEARGLPHPASLQSAPLEQWERDLCSKEILLLTGTSEDCFGYLAMAWGQPYGFHETMVEGLFGEQSSDTASRLTIDTLKSWEEENVDLLCGDLSYIETLAANLFDFDSNKSNNNSFSISSVNNSSSNNKNKNSFSISGGTNNLSNTSLKNFSFNFSSNNNIINSNHRYPSCNNATSLKNNKFSFSKNKNYQFPIPNTASVKNSSFSFSNSSNRNYQFPSPNTTTNSVDSNNIKTSSNNGMARGDIHQRHMSFEGIDEHYMEKQLLSRWDSGTIGQWEL